MIRFIDISNHQKGMDLSKVLPSVGGVICKATEGTGFVDADDKKYNQFLSFICGERTGTTGYPFFRSRRNNFPP